MAMELEIKKLTPQNLNDFLTFFETDAHADNPQEDRCYCVCWSAEDHTAPVDLSSPQARRALAVQYVQRGTLQGYLAYAQGRVVGWCNANNQGRLSKVQQLAAFSPRCPAGRAGCAHKVGLLLYSGAGVQALRRGFAAAAARLCRCCRRGL